MPTPLPNTYWVRPGRLLAGEYPGALHPDGARLKLRALLAGGVDFFVDLTEPGELEPYAGLLAEAAAALGRSAQHTRLSIPDLGLPAPEHMRRILDTIDAALAAGHTLYVHCWGGVGRTGTVVGCHLRRSGLNGEQALAQIAEWWRGLPPAKQLYHPRSPETDEQHAFVRGWKEKPDDPA